MFSLFSVVFLAFKTCVQVGITVPKKTKDVVFTARREMIEELVQLEFPFGS